MAVGTESAFSADNGLTSQPPSPSVLTNNSLEGGTVLGKQKNQLKLKFKLKLKVKVKLKLLLLFAFLLF